MMMNDTMKQEVFSTWGTVLSGFRLTPDGVYP